VSYSARITQERALLSFELRAHRQRPMAPFRFVTGLRFPGAIDVDALQQALNAVIARHDALRTAFRPNPALSPRLRHRRLEAFIRHGLFMPGMYVQAVVPVATVVVTRDAEPVTGEEEICRAIEADVLAPFDWHRPPLMRARVLPLADGGDLVVLIVSHLVADGWSMAILHRELIQTYRALCGEATCSLPPVDLQHPEFAGWERAHLLAGRFDQSLSYWERLWSAFEADQLSMNDFGAEPPMAARPPVVTGSERLAFDHETTDRIRAFCRAMRVTPYVFCRAALMTALHHVTRKPRLAIGGNFANRMHPQTAQTIGWFNNRHLLAGDFSARPTGTEVLLNTKIAAIEAMTHQAVPASAVWRLWESARPLALTEASITFDFDVQRGADAGPWHGISSYPVGQYAARWMWRDLDIRAIDRDASLTIEIMHSLNRHPRAVISLLLEAIRKSALGLVTDARGSVAGYVDAVC
jgi:hypothetical protein